MGDETPPESEKPDLPEASGAIGPDTPAELLDNLANGEYEGENARLRSAMAVDAED
ncbi:MAG TPA: hypothetical protein VHB69_08680 [Mycobacteriales bacterium]|nr:hypothetical protein [Mycobacteriales bacterium]